MRSQPRSYLKMSKSNASRRGKPGMMWGVGQGLPILPEWGLGGVDGGLLRSQAGKDGRIFSVRREAEG